MTRNCAFLTLGLSLALASLTACSPARDAQSVDNVAAGNTPYPTLLPIEETLVLDTPRLSENSEEELDARANRLRRRAQDLFDTPVQ